MYLIYNNLLRTETIVAIVLLSLLMSTATSNCYAHGIAEDNLYNRPGQEIGLACDANIWDFGEISLAEAAYLTHNFVLQNTSTQYINILDYSSTCGCTSVELPKKSIAPEEYVNVLVNVDWASRAGKQRETVFLKMDHPAISKISLTVEGIVVVRAILSPSAIDFGLLKPGQQRKHIVKLIQGPDTSPFKISGVDKHSEYVHIRRVTPTNKGNQAVSLEGDAGDFEVTFTCPEVAGNHDTVIDFHTNIEDQHILRLPVRAASRGTLSVVPNFLFFEQTLQDTNNLQELRVDYTGTDKQLNAEMLPTQEGLNPFYIKDIKFSAQSEKTSAVIIVGFQNNIANRLLCQSTLRTRVGKEVLDIPVVALVGTTK